jgi:hypothetical protein
VQQTLRSRRGKPARSPRLRDGPAHTVRSFRGLLRLHGGRARQCTAAGHRGPRLRAARCSRCTRRRRLVAGHEDGRRHLPPARQREPAARAARGASMCAASTWR